MCRDLLVFCKCATKILNWLYQNFLNYRSSTVLFSKWNILNYPIYFVMRINVVNCTSVWILIIIRMRENYENVLTSTDKINIARENVYPSEIRNYIQDSNDVKISPMCYIFYWSSSIANLQILQSICVKLF